MLTTRDQAQLPYRVTGSGTDTVIVLAGSPGLSQRMLWRALAPLDKHRVLVFYDMRWRGDAPVVPGSRGPSLAADIDDLEALRAHLGIARASLIGHYYGAAVAAFYARAHPERVDRLVLLAPIQASESNSYELSLWSTRRPDDLVGYGEALLARQDTLDPEGFCRTYWLRRFEPLWINDEGVRRYHADDVCPRGGVRPGDVTIASESLVVNLNRAGWEWLDSLPQVGQPALVLGGASDPVRRFLFRWWAFALADGRVLLLEDGEPTMPWVANRARVAQAIASFLGGEWPEGSVRPQVPPAPDVTPDEQARMPMSAHLVDP